MPTNKVEIIISAINKSGAAFKGLKDDLDKVGTNGEKARVVMGKLSSVLGAAGVTGAVIAVGNAVKKSVTEWSAYAEEIQKAADLSGVTTEEMSRLVQAADDMRVSQDSLKTAMQMALKNGFTPTIKNIAKLSDELLAIEDPAERAEKASKIFGRQWAEIAPMLLKGGDAIIANTAAIADNLVVTEEAVKQNAEYIKAVDDLNDAWTGFSNTVGQKVLPALTNVLKALNGEEVNRAVNGYERMFKSATDNLAAFEDVGKDVNEMLRETGAAGDVAALGTQAMADATNNADEAMRKYSEALLFSIASQGLTEDAALDLAYKMGLVDEKTVAATEKVRDYQQWLADGKITLDEYNEKVAALADGIARLEDKDITITVTEIKHYIQTYSSGDSGGEGGMTEEAYADGGRPSLHKAVLVGEEGPELAIFDNPATILPNDAISGGSSVNNWNLTINEAGSRGNVAQDFAILKALAA